MTKVVSSSKEYVLKLSPEDRIYLAANKDGFVLIENENEFLLVENKGVEIAR